MERQEIPDSRVRGVRTGTRVRTVPQEHQEHRDLLVNKERQVSLDLQVLKDPLVL